MKGKSKETKPKDTSFWKPLAMEGVPVLLVIGLFVVLAMCWDTIVDWIGDDIEYTVLLAINVYRDLTTNTEASLGDKLLLLFYLSVPLAVAMLLRRFLANYNNATEVEEQRKTKLRINDPTQKGLPNQIKTTRYSKYSLVPLVLLEQMTKPDNIYFEIVVYIQVVYPELSPTGRHSTYPGLVLTFVWKIISIAVEQMFLWYGDMQENIEPYKKLNIASDSKETFQWVRSEDIKQGDIIWIGEDEAIPFDGVAIGASDKMFQVNMSLLNGEISPHKKYPIDLGMSVSQYRAMIEDGDFKFFKGLRGEVECNPPTHLLDSFDGIIRLENKKEEIPFNVKNAVYRGTKMKGTEWILVYVTYTGQLTKVGKCFKKVSLKQTALDTEFVKHLKFNFMLLGTLITISTIYGVLAEKVERTFESFVIEVTINFLHLNGLNNLSSQLMADMVRIGQRRQIIQDHTMSCLVNRKDVLDEIVDELVTDKTGTLTENSLVLTHLAIGQQLFEVAHNMDMLASFPDQDLIKAMSFCHDVTPRSGEMLFSTVEDLKFVTFAKLCGYHLVDRTPNHVSIAHNDELLNYDVLHFNEFESRKKHMSIIVQRHTKDGKKGPIELWFKGADIETYPRLDKNNKLNQFEEIIRERTDKLTKQGLRVLLWAKRELGNQEYNEWNKQHAYIIKQEGEKSPNLDASWNKIEQNLVLLGGTAIEDKMQPGTEGVLKFCKECGIHVSVATGDSENTAVAIMKQLDQIHGEPIMLVAGSAVTTVDEEELDKKMKLLRELKVKPGEDRTIVVDGKTLAVIVNGKHKKEFASIIVNKFQTRIFARVSAIQKAEIVQLYKSLGKRVFSIGDGGNDVTMIQEAHFGVGIRGVEGHQAASAADFQLTRFQEVQTVLAHSLRSHFRLATVYLWNDYKAVLIAMIAYFSRALRGFQGDALIPGNVIFSLNTLDLAYPVVLFGMFDELVPLERLIKESKHYPIGQKLQRFNRKRKFTWWAHAFLHSFVIVALSQYFLRQETSATINAFVIGVTAGQIVSVVSNFRLMMECRRWNWVVMTAASSSIYLLLKFVKFNPFGQRKVPIKVNVQYILYAVPLCLAIDIILMLLSDGECPLLTREFWSSTWKEWKWMAATVQNLILTTLGKAKDVAKQTPAAFKAPKTKAE